jgi:hypothetical protein
MWSDESDKLGQNFADRLAYDGVGRWAAGPARATRIPRLIG